MEKVFSFITVVTVLVCVNATCNKCQQNGVACINKTSFQPCHGGSKPYSNQTFNCPDGMDCTELPNICFQRGGWDPSCDNLSKCNICNTNRVFACTSQTTFAFCFGATTSSNVKGTCPKGYVCVLTSNSICVPLQIGAKPSCDILQETTRVFK
ncbi:uncharacterized protein LOC129911478 [Episyrphus balteatus]|uniref:uncharacterized protein LOC129911478 n=1 Tax=Episyrphus balteatus TaxID=286459 RepID=UPI002485C1E1|nr:uncharacterized protein LOC129911478 [Episyrphus balteatus]